MRELLEKERELLSVFRKYLPYEKGYVLSVMETRLKEISHLSISSVKELIPEIDSYTNFQKANFLRYLAFLKAIYEYERELKRLEYEERDMRLAQLKDERLLNIARALKKRVKEGKETAKEAEVGETERRNFETEARRFRG
nr:hypothetical protein [uncultured bacterium]